MARRSKAASTIRYSASAVSVLTGNQTEQWDDVVLFNELTTESIRMLLPVSMFEVDSMLRLFVSHSSSCGLGNPSAKVSRLRWRWTPNRKGGSLLASVEWDVRTAGKTSGVGNSLLDTSNAWVLGLVRQISPRCLV